MEKSYVYKITNKMTGKYYIGVHTTKDINDGYFGSSKLLNKDLKYFGLINFNKEILKEFDDPNDAYNYEKEIVNSEFIKKCEVYNEHVGGSGGYSNNNLPILKISVVKNYKKIGYFIRTNNYINKIIKNYKEEKIINKEFQVCSVPVTHDRKCKIVKHKNGFQISIKNKKYYSKKSESVQDFYKRLITTIPTNFIILIEEPKNA